MHEKPQNHQKYQKRQKHQKNKDATKQKHKILQADSKVWWSTTPIIVLPYILTKTSFLAPFKKPFLYKEV